MRLLLVEDYLPLRNSISLGLREEGFAVDCTGDGEEGLWFAQSNDYDVIILDLMLPGIDGLSILTALRAAGSTVQVLILTAKGKVEDRVRGLDLGADDYLVKPFAMEELLARLRVLLRRQYQVKNSVIQVGELEIDSSSQKVRYQNEEIELRAREYALLHYLALRKGEVVSRSEIWEHLYEFHSSTASNVIDVYISQLRRKLTKGKEIQLIRTYRGRGYALECPR